MENFYYAQIASSIGPLNLAVSAIGLVALEFNRGEFPPTKKKGIKSALRVLYDARLAADYRPGCS